MPLTVQQLINLLEQIGNKHAEVEIELYDIPSALPSVHSVTTIKGKCILRPDRKYRK